MALLRVQSLIYAGQVMKDKKQLQEYKVPKVRHQPLAADSTESKFSNRTWCTSLDPLNNTGANLIRRLHNEGISKLLADTACRDFANTGRLIT